MDIKIIFRIAFWILFGGWIVMQIYLSARVQQTGERVAADRQAIECEGWGYIICSLIPLAKNTKPTCEGPGDCSRNEVVRRSRPGG